MISFYQRLARLYPGPFRIRHETDLIFAVDEEWTRVRDLGFTERLRFAIRIVWDFIVTFQREWRRASPWETQATVVGLSVVLGLEIASHDYKTMEAQGLLGTCFVVGGVVGHALRRAGSFVKGSSLVGLSVVSLMVPSVVTKFSYGSPDDSWMDVANIVILAVLILQTVDILRNRPWKGNPSSPFPSKKESWALVSGIVAHFSALAGIIVFYPNHGIEAAPDLGTTMIVLMQLSIQARVLWLRSERFTDFETYTYPRGRG